MKSLDKERLDVQFVFMLLYLPKVIGNLVTHPTFRATAKGHGQAKRHLRGNAGIAVYNFRQSFTADAKSKRGFSNRKAHGVKP